MLALLTGLAVVTAVAVVVNLAEGPSPVRGRRRHDAASNAPVLPNRSGSSGSRAEVQLDVAAPDASPASAIGALFHRNPKTGALERHYCTATVIDSPTGNVVVTAAHCLGRNPSPEATAFIPAYSGGRHPYGIWYVDRILEGAGWTVSKNPDDDFALLVVYRPGSSLDIEQVTGGERIGYDWPAGALAVATGYPDKLDEPIICSNLLSLHSPTQWRFACPGFVGGTSGTPFVTDVNPATGLGTLLGVLGGFEGGGYKASVSYAPRIGANLRALLAKL